MDFFLAAALLTALAIFAIVLPLWRTDPGGSGVGSDRVYRDQLSQVDKDLAAGLVSESEATEARAEIGRRLIAAADEADAEPGVRTGQHPILALTLALGVPILVGGVYLGIGSPGTPDAPLAARDIPEAAQDSQMSNRSMPDAEMPELIERLIARLEETPEDEEGWALLARSYFSVDRMDDAVAAYERAIRINGRTDAALLGEYGEILVVARGGQVVPDAAAAFRDVLARWPDDPRASFFLALARAQAGDISAAMTDWAQLLHSAPADSPWHAQVLERVTSIARDAGVDPADFGIDEGGPTAEQVAEAGQMAAGDRRAMIANMVAGLRERLEIEEPDNLDGWKRLARAYGVLNRAEDELYALENAARLAPEDGELRVRIRALKNVGATASPRGPSTEDIQAMAEETPADRQAMIATMVAGLRERLETEEPENLNGWLQLARSYNVLSQTENEVYALRKAAALAPGNPAVELPLAEILMEQTDGAVSPEIRAGLIRTLETDPASRPALWHLGRAAITEGDMDGARDLWTRLLATLEPGSSDHQAVSEALQNLSP